MSTSGAADTNATKARQTPTPRGWGAGGVSGRLDDAEDFQKEEDDEDGNDDVQDIQDLALLGPFCPQPVEPRKRIHARTVPASPGHPKAAGEGGAGSRV